MLVRHTHFWERHTEGTDCIVGKCENCYIFLIELYMCSIAGNLCFKNMYRTYVDLNTMEQCFVTLFYKTFHHSMLMYILCTVLLSCMIVKY